MYFDKGLTSGKKTEKALLYGKILTEAYQKTDDDVFLIIAHGFLGRMENDLCYRGGADEDIAKVMEKKLQTLAILSENARKNSVMKDAVFAKISFWAGAGDDLAGYLAASRKAAHDGRRAELLKCPEYLSALEKYAPESRG